MIPIPVMASLLWPRPCSQKPPSLALYVRISVFVYLVTSSSAYRNRISMSGIPKRIGAISNTTLALLLASCRPLKLPRLVICGWIILSFFTLPRFRLPCLTFLALLCMVRSRLTFSVTAVTLPVWLWLLKMSPIPPQLHPLRFSLILRKLLIGGRPVEPLLLQLLSPPTVLFPSLPLILLYPLLLLSKMVLRFPSPYLPLITLLLRLRIPLPQPEII